LLLPKSKNVVLGKACLGPTFKYFSPLYVYQRMINAS